MTDKPKKPGLPRRSLLSTSARLRDLGDTRVPLLRYGFFPPWSGAGVLRLVLPFRRHWPLIIGLGIFLLLFSLPLLSVWQHSGLRDDSLFSLVFSLFNILWGLGWSVGVVGIALIFLVLLLGREVMVVRDETVLLYLDLLCLGIGAEYPAKGISGLRTARPDENVGSGWRGAHLAFDYYKVPVAFGSALVEPRSSEILELLRERLAGIDGEFSGADAVVVPAGGEEPPDPSGPPRVELNRGGIPDVSDDQTGTSTYSSSVALIIANLVPLVGVVFLNWNIGEIMLLYWSESGIIAIYNLLKMVVVGGWMSIFSGIFFVGHFGGFMVVHFLFIYTFFAQGRIAQSGIPVSEVGDTFISLWPALLALVISHGISFRVNFLGRREFAGTTVSKLLGEPYGRIAIMHITILLGGFIAMELGSSLPALLLLIGIKSYADLRSHARQHR